MNFLINACSMILQAVQHGDKNCRPSSRRETAGTLTAPLFSAIFVTVLKSLGIPLPEIGQFDRSIEAVVVL